MDSNLLPPNNSASVLLGQVKDYLTKYFLNNTDELATQDGMVFRGDRIVIPYVLRRKLVDSCHVSHNGTESTLKLARANLFWPGMSSQIKDVVKECSICAKYAPSQPNPPMMSHNIPVYPFQMVSMDVFQAEHRGIKRKFLVTVDHYSDFFELDILKDLTPESVIFACQQNFARHGKPQRLISDNATNFSNVKMVKFARDWDIELVTSAPHHQQANGKSEAAVKIAKRLITKADETNTDFWYALLHWRNIPNKIGSSPAARLFSRQTRCGVPTSVSNLLPRVVNDVPTKIENNRKTFKRNYDKTCRHLPELQIGSPVYTQLQPEFSKTWRAGTIADRLSERSYLVNVDGVDYRRSLVHLKPRKEPNILPDRRPSTLVSSNSFSNSDIQLASLPDGEKTNGCQMESHVAPQFSMIESQQTASPSTSRGGAMRSSTSCIPTTPKQKEKNNFVPEVSSNRRPKRLTRIPEKFKDFELAFK
ncbi:uncharacterized protein K02A2.6-like [Sabethes cyaneus]|uniref:uncharacterized protein K02A2.6-like n=1 Tax=Sabethes cyaneus TaxID=53552 RepID=UPI00237D9A28|nr:uncharacterized protein K02A2.6-like [Sabethes cyaneus]